MLYRVTLSLLVGTVLMATAFCGQAVASQQIKVWIAGTTLKIRDTSIGNPVDGDFDNAIDVKAKRDQGVVYIAEEFGTAVAGPGCTAGSFTEDTSAGNPEDLWYPNYVTYQVTCPIAFLKKIDINAGPGDDSVQVILSPIPVKIVGGEGNDYDVEYWSCGQDGMVVPYFSTSTISGGLGDDYIVGGRGNDRLTGGRGYDYLEGTCGEDRLSGGSDGDELVTNEQIWCDSDCGPTRDFASCGDGDDAVIVDDLDVFSTKLCENVIHD